MTTLAAMMFEIFPEHRDPSYWCCKTRKSLNIVRIARPADVRGHQQLFPTNIKMYASQGPVKNLQDSNNSFENLSNSHNAFIRIYI